jgi:transcriptional regulator with XRE-family HTH domain
MTDPDNSRLVRLKPIPDPASPPGRLAQALRELARAAGFENLRQLAECAHVALGRVSEALSGKTNLVPTKEVVEAICNACNADEPTRAHLQDLRDKAWRFKQAALSTDDPPPPSPTPGEAVDPQVSGSSAGLVNDGMTDPHGDISQQGPLRWRWWTRPVVLVVVVLSLVLASTAAWVINALVNACGGFGSGVSRVDGECVGVTDGSYVFDPALADVEAKIAAENARVAGSGHTVTVALLNLMTVNNTSPVPIAEVVNQLEGAYTAQYRANHTTDLGDPSPLIRLVLANEGSHENQWQPVVHQIEGMVGDKDPLVAVTGLGVSTTQTEDGAKDLAAHHIPMVGAITTADELNYKDIPGFVRVAPSTAELVQSLSAYLQHRHNQQRQDFDSAILVYDTNSDDSGDLFTKSLRNDLASGMRSLIKSTPPQGFTGTSGQSPGNPDLFSVNDWQYLCSKRGETTGHTVRWPRA